MSASTPSKRRKKNDHQASPQTKGLDYFFNKQREQQKEQLSPTRTSIAPKNDDRAPLTDEELARRLQEEWDREDEALRSSQNELGASHTDQAPTSPSHRPKNGEPSVEEDEQNDTDMPDEPTTPTAAKAPSGPQTLSLQSVTSDEDSYTNSIPFDENPLTFDPSNYTPKLKQLWSADGGHASYGLLTRCFVLVASTTSRIKTVDALVNFLRTLIEADPESLLPAVWLTTNSISPPYISLELGLGGSAISKALKKVCGLDGHGLKTLYNQHGDAGDVAFEAKKKQSFTLRKPKPLTVQGVYRDLVKIAESRGTGSQEVKQRVVERLLQGAQSAEQSRFLVRTLCQHLRIGAVKTTMLIALSRAFLLSRPAGAPDGFPQRDRAELAKLKKEQLAEIWSRAEELVKASFARRPNYNDLVPTLLEIGVCDELLVRCGLALHIPLRPMLGSITRDLGEMLTKLQGRDFSCEFKYDGQRAQVHCDANGKVSIFSRHLEVMTDKYPDLVALVPTIRGDGVSSFILEGEVVAVDRTTGDLKPFQVLTNRARKDVVIGAINIDVCLFSFDLMYLNGESLLDRSFRERRSLLRSLFVEVPNQFTWVRNIDSTSEDSESVLEFFKAATDIKCEGIMVKILDNAPKPGTEAAAEEEEAKKDDKTNGATDKKQKGSRRKALLSTYEPDKRLDSWLKVKKDYSSSADTLDLIPVAGWHGQGRKSKWWSPILLAARNPATGSLEAVTKCISGFTDKFYQANKEKYAEGSDNVISRPGYVEYGGWPDVWFEPQEVWEMAFADITLSPTYTAAIGLVSEERGLSTRFPRFLKVREDKSIEEASTVEFLAGLYRKQEARIKAEGGDPTGEKAEEEGDDE